ncbi:hypothetical protein GC167_01760 [bacterium]|nr:hypothetical protein [bacterium]
MEFSLDRTQPLEAVLRIQISQDEVRPKVEDALKHYRKNATLPGFRKGMVPEGLVRKQYGKSILIDEVNRALNEGLDQYLNTQQLSILGQPLPVPQDDLNWDAPSWSFDFELGLTPEFSLDLGALTVEKPVALVSDAHVDEEIDRLRRRFGRQLDAEVIEIEDFITAELAPVDGGHSHQIAFRMQRPELSLALPKLLGQAEGSEIELSLSTDFTDLESAARLFNMDPGHLAEHGDLQRLSIRKIIRVEPSEMDADFFAKVDETVIDLDSLKAFVRQGLERENDQRSTHVFTVRVREAVRGHLQFDLPVAFLTKWLMQQRDQPLSQEEAEIQIEHMIPGLRWQLIEGRAAREFGLNVEQDDVMREAYNAMYERFGNNLPTNDPSVLQRVVDRMMQDENEVRNLTERALSRKTLEALAVRVTATEVPVTSDALIEEYYGAY